MTWSILEAFGIVRESPEDDEKRDKDERGETADQRRRRELDAAKAAGNPLTQPSKAGAGGGENRPVGIARTSPTKDPTPLGTGRGVARRVSPGASTLKAQGRTQASMDRDAPDDALPGRRSTTPAIKPGHKGSFVGQVWQPTGVTQKWSNKYFDAGSGTDKRTSGERQAKRPEALFWDGNDWVPQAHFVMGKRGLAPPTQPVKGQSSSMTPLPPSREEAEQEAKREIQRVMTKGSRDREEARKAAADVYDRYDQKYAEYSRTTGKPPRKIERPDWISGERPASGGAWSDIGKKLGGPPKARGIQPTYHDLKDVPAGQRDEIEKWLAAQAKSKGPAPVAPTATSEPSTTAPAERPPTRQAPGETPWRALQRMTGGAKEKESDADVLARMKARHGVK
jgi:hypothetical protein